MFNLCEIIDTDVTQNKMSHTKKSSIIIIVCPGKKKLGHVLQRSLSRNRNTRNILRNVFLNSDRAPTSLPTVQLRQWNLFAQRTNRYDDDRCFIIYLLRSAYADSVRHLYPPHQEKNDTKIIPRNVFATRLKHYIVISYFTIK